ncbi:hypothetical protein NDU88_003243 [Pleurodeles waltl]|uniref:Uncharacterized protein n=1 Tax=Pleurodeles waltl TaxID=8319 RepID=A0AAV7UYF5_PLEWA|nr:hypothetical protein NDU88_003243 [Pleurodeles waltl]
MWVPAAEQEGWGGRGSATTSRGPVKQGPRLRSRVAMALPPLRPGSHDGRRGSGNLRVRSRGEKDPSREGSVRARVSRTGSRRTHKPIRAIRSGSGGTVRPRQDVGRPPCRSLRIRWWSVSGGPGEPGAHPFLSQRGTFERRPRLWVMVAVPSPLSRFLPVCHARCVFRC